MPSDRKPSATIEAPFTDEQLRHLNAWQQRCGVHPFTCGNEGCRCVLRATTDGWICPNPAGCDYKQNWAHDFMARSEEP